MVMLQIVARGGIAGYSLDIWVVQPLGGPEIHQSSENGPGWPLTAHHHPSSRTPEDAGMESVVLSRLLTSPELKDSRVTTSINVSATLIVAYR